MKRGLVAAVLACVGLLLAGCGGNVRDHLGDNFEYRSKSGSVTTYHSPDPVGTTVSRIVADDEPSARRADGNNEYLRYSDDIVTVGPAAGGGSTVTVEDLGRYNGGHFAYLGPVFSPGSPAAGNVSGGSGSAK
nr:DUF4247 domain-containing protein [Prescottella subtropica]